MNQSINRNGRDELYVRAHQSVRIEGSQAGLPLAGISPGNDLGAQRDLDFLSSSVFSDLLSALASLHFKSKPNPTQPQIKFL